MLDFKITCDTETGEKILETTAMGKFLLTTPQLNKGTAFTHEERHEFGLLGKLPGRVETIDEQVKRAYLQYSNYNNQLQQNIYLNSLHDQNQILFYKLLSRHLDEMLPTIYTPIVGTAVKSFSREYRHARGLYISYHDMNHLDDIIGNRSNPDIDLIVLTDGESVLGIGDQGIGGMDIPVAKLMVYSICGGIEPTRTLPIFLDVGTNNPELLDDPLYLGCRHPRISQAQYDAFTERFIETIQRHFPNVFLHWEDLGRNNARRVLKTYQNQLCCFNDDIQGTGAVTLAALLAACDIAHTPLTEHRIMIYGAGSAGTGISDQIAEALIRSGLSIDEARQRFWLIDRQGLLMRDDVDLTESQTPYARAPLEISDWIVCDPKAPSFTEAVRHVKPTILIGCSAQPGAFSQDIVEIMAIHSERPIIFPLSNPDEKCEAQPADILNWTQGKALVATGTAFPVVEFHNRMLEIAQCNNALIFPGIGLGILAVQARRLTDDMIWAASLALSELSPCKKDSSLPLLPSLGDSKMVAKHVAKAVAIHAVETGLADYYTQEEIAARIDATYWEPRYLPYKRI